MQGNLIGPQFPRWMGFQGFQRGYHVLQHFQVWECQRFGHVWPTLAQVAESLKGFMFHMQFWIITYYNHLQFSHTLHSHTFTYKDWPNTLVMLPHHLGYGQGCEDMPNMDLTKQHLDLQTLQHGGLAALSRQACWNQQLQHRQHRQNGFRLHQAANSPCSRNIRAQLARSRNCRSHLQLQALVSTAQGAFCHEGNLQLLGAASIGSKLHCKGLGWGHPFGSLEKEDVILKVSYYLCVFMRI